MRFVPPKRIIAALTAILMLFVCILPASALDNRYRFEDLKMAVSVPKDYYVITRDSKSSDEVFKTMKLGYDETMIAFENSDIYLRAYAPDKTYWLSVIVTVNDESKTINNYSDITEAERKEICDNVKAAEDVETAVEVKHNKNIFFDTSGSTKSGKHTLYVNQSNTVINGMQINLVLQKNDEEIIPVENKSLVNLANSLEFDEIKRTTGPDFSWWRLLLWAAILVGLAVVISVLYRRHNAVNRRRLQERREKRELEQARLAGEPVPEPVKETFEEKLGYEDEEQFEDRAATDLDTYEIKVRERDPKRGITYFEDSGESIDDGSDYFDTYFREPAETRKGAARFFGALGTYLKIAFKRLGYFFTNIKRTIFKKKK